MRGFLYIAVALAVLAGLYFSGVIAAYNIAHPFWRGNATMFGGLAGAVLTFALFWLSRKFPKLARGLLVIIGLIFVVSLYVTTHYAKVFIDAADYDRMAVEIWHKGSYTVIASFVVVVAHSIRKAIG